MKENKFLTGFLIVVLLGAGALGFLLFQAKGKYTEATTAYSDKVSELQSLQGGKPYPDEANYKKVLELQKAHQVAIGDLQKQLAAAEIPVEPMTPEKFQDNLREAIKRVRALAAQKGTKIGEGETTTEKFSLGFELYESQPPKPEAAAPLGRMLKAIEKVVTELLNTSPTKLNANIKRQPLPEEGVGQKPAATPAPKTGAGPVKKAVEEAPLVKRYPFDIEFVAHEPKVRTFINKIVSSKDQFLIPSAVVIANEQLTGPSKAGLTASAEPPPQPAADPNAPAATPPATPPVDPATPAATPSAEAPKFVVGEEKLTVQIRIEVVDFADPVVEKPAAKSGKPAPAK